MTRDHGGNIDGAIARFGGTGWIDLSTGINRAPYPIPALRPEDWTMLPTRSAKAALLDVAQKAYRTSAPILAVAGAQAAIQMIPRLGFPAASPDSSPPNASRTARILGPTYNEHAAALRAAGWRVEEVSRFTQLPGAELAVVVNPNNPDGKSYPAEDILALASQVGRLVVDESFADPRPELSVAAQAGQGGLIVLRSFGKFYGLAGVRLGFVLGSAPEIAALSEMAGPWPVSGAALRIGQTALADAGWAAETTQRLRGEALQADALATGLGWSLVGGCELFRSYETPDAEAAQTRLAKHQVWSRIFPWSNRWLRLGLPAGASEWARFAAAMRP